MSDYQQFEKNIKRWPLWEAWMKREKTKPKRISKSKAKIARYGRVLTGNKLEVV